MTVTIPEFVTAEGNVKVAWIPAIADLNAPTLVELNAGVDITCYLPETWGGITADQAKGEQRRMCSKESFETLGRIKRAIADITYTYLPQAPGTDPANKVKTTLTAGAHGFLATRYGLPATDAWSASDVLDVLPAEAGAQNKNTGGSDEFAPLTITQGLSATGVLVEDATAA